MTPLYIVDAEGQNITALVAGRLKSLRVVLKPGRNADTFELLIDDTGDVMETPRKGAKLKIWMGYVEIGLTYMGQFTVDEVSVNLVPQELRISGKAANVRDSAKSQKTRHFDDGTTLQKVYQKIAADNGLTLSIDGTIGKIKTEYLLQSEESDLHLATRLADKYGAIAKVADGKLIVTKRGSAQSASGKAMETIIITRQHIKKGGGKLKDRARYGSVSATWHDQTKAKKTAVKESQGEGPDYQLRQTFQTAEEAKAACKAKLAELQRQEADVSFTTQGNPRIDTETRLRWVGVSRKLDGDWIVKQAAHIMAGSPPGYETQVEGETPGQRKDQKGKGKGKGK